MFTVFLPKNEENGTDVEEDEDTEKCSSGVIVEEINSDHEKDQNLNMSEFMSLKLSENETLDFKDCGTWPEKIIDSQRTHIVRMRMNYIEKLNLTRSEREGRSVNVSWFFKNLINGNQCRRTWLSYSKSKNALFCVPCKLFLNSNDKNISKLALDGFINWKKVSERIPEHENSNIHKKYFCSWKMLEISICEGKGIDIELQNAIKLEENH
ncbi:zinc finger MYM-type protein 5-like [Sipha flava]|uniref:Zinc finger MYM-type protein 5-like n=1 Tax=Sipha flava TaxID=143950 RepID=A0A8B8F3U7_9HEMI|nr:zinc finger MYM-type protein 5-like [Sipha flava]